jgi:hypothetical protein
VKRGSEDERGGVGRGCGTPFIGPEGAGGGGSMGGQPAAINGACFISKEKWGAEEVEGWRCRFTTGEEVRWPGGEPGGRSFDRPVVAAWHCRRRKKTP